RREHDDAQAAYENAVAMHEAARRRLAQTEQEVQQAQAELAARLHAVDVAKQKVAEARGTVARAEGQQGQVTVKEAEVVRAEAALKQAQADLALAELQLAYTEVKAPADGVVSKRTVELGQVVQPGQPLLAIVPLHEVCVLAKFKETQLARVRPGMRADVEIDGLPGKVFHGIVESISAGTGARRASRGGRTRRTSGGTLPAGRGERASDHPESRKAGGQAGDPPHGVAARHRLPDQPRDRKDGDPGQVHQARHAQQRHEGPAAAE